MPDQTAPTPRKSPKQTRAQHTVAAILEAAARILEERGLEAANTNAIAARAGISVGSLYQYFGSKDAILAELARSTELATARELEQASLTLEGLSFEDQARKLIHVAFGLVYARPQLGRILAYHQARMHKDEAMIAAGERMTATIAQVLERSRGHHARRNCIVAARDILVIVEALALTADHNGETELAGLEERVSVAVLGYLTYPDPL